MGPVARRALRFRGLLATLTRRELAARYRGSALGFLWSLVNPLLLTAVYTVVFGFVLEPGRGRFVVEPYPVFLIAGLFPWLWASSAVLEGTVSLTANSGLLRKAVFPVELPPLVSVLANLIHFLIALPVVLAALGLARVAGFAVGGWGVLWLPLIIVLQAFLLGGLVLAGSALHALFKDVRDLVQNGMTLLFFLAPIIYPFEVVPEGPLRTVLLVNPFTSFFRAYQEALFFGRTPPTELWLHMVLVSAIAWSAGSWLFNRLRSTLAELS